MRFVRTLDELGYDPLDFVNPPDELECPNYDWTTDVPPLPGTSDMHPMDCPCIPCRDREERWYWSGATRELDEYSG